MTRVICLTGGIASGKSTAARFLKEHGAHVIDADLLGHQSYEPGSPAHAKVVEAFGSEVVAADGRIDRKILGAKVFGKPSELKKLTDIVWPAIRTLAADEIARVRAQRSAPLIVLEAAILFEAGWQDLGDETWVCIVDREVAIERAMARDAAERAGIERRLDAQLSNADRIARADVVIDNDGTPEQMLARLRRHWERVRSTPVLRMPHVGPEVELDGVALRRALDRGVVDLHDHVARADAAAGGGRVVDRGDDLQRAVRPHHHLQPEAAVFAAGLLVE